MNCAKCSHLQGSRTFRRKAKPTSLCSSDCRAPARPPRVPSAYHGKGHREGGCLPFFCCCSEQIQDWPPIVRAICLVRWHCALISILLQLRKVQLRCLPPAFTPTSADALTQTAPTLLLRCACVARLLLCRVSPAGLCVLRVYGKRPCRGRDDPWRILCFSHRHNRMPAQRPA